jgi:hypothetical protein
MLHAVQRLPANWKAVLAITVVALVGIQLFDPRYNHLQTAHDAAGFRHALRSPARSVGATMCDIVFAAGYGALAVAGVRSLAVSRAAARILLVGALAGALFDELENLALVSNIVRHATITDTAITVMRVFGTLKWAGFPFYLAILVAITIRLLRPNR